MEPAKEFHVRYELVRPLGEGGFGAVFEAVERQTGRRLALKELVRVNPSALARFKQEFRALQDLHHPNLVHVQELFEHAGRWFIAMELVEGEDLLSWVRPSPPSHNQNGSRFNEVRLRTALCDVARGLSALHEHGILHRDLKPANVRVESNGRAVLLDFGLVTTLDPGAQSTQAGAIGTAAYMAPEQATGVKVGPEADWYSLGVCLYEALTGRLPFDAPNAIQVLLLKQGPLPPPPSSLQRDLPEDLEQLCMRLLDPLPEARPMRSEILGVLEATAAPSFLEQSSTINVQGLTFAGREGELEHLERAYERAEQGALSILLIEGESGMGKSALVDEFLRQQRLRHPDTWVLKGRCYENEQVPYKAFDGCIDALAKTLKRVPASEIDLALPPRAGVLGQLFPVLREVKALAQAPMREVSADPTARRLEAFAALSALFRNLSDARPIVLVIDDLQWADAESFRMLRALADDGNPAPLLILSTVRPRSELEGEVLQQLDVVRGWRTCEVLSLHGLPRAQARSLVSSLLGGNAPSEWTRVIVEESRGHPLFISTLVQYAASHDMGGPGALTLEAALSARVNDLGDDAHALLELIALSGRPCSEHVFARALGGQRGCASAKRVLLSRKLVRVRRNDELVCFHDRIRSVVSASIGSARLPTLHRMLARSLDSDASCDASERARHWDAAGEPERAAEAYERAADLALESLAFAQAEASYARALALLEQADDPRRLRLLVQRGHALARGARSAEAARSYQEASERATGEARVRLRIAVALHLLQGAHFDEGMQTVRALLEDLGLHLPKGNAALLARVAWQRLRVALRGLEFEIKPPSDIPAAERLLLDAISELGFAVGWVDMMAGVVLNGVRLGRALALGESTHIARALAEEGVFRAIQSPSHSEANPLFWKRTRELVAGSTEPALSAYQLLMEGTASLILCDYAAARERLEAAEQILQTRCPGEPWLLTNVRMSLGAALFYTSAHSRLRQQTTAWIAQAEERRDRFALTALVGIGAGYVRHLMDDDAERALGEVREVLAPWPNDVFSLAHLGELVGTCIPLLYRGGGQLYDWFAQHEARLQGAFLLKAGVGRETLLLHRALAALAKVAASDASSHPALLRQARRDMTGLRRLTTPRAASLADLVEAQLEALAGHTAEAIALAERARVGFSKRHVLYQYAAAYLEGVLGGGPEAQTHAAAATAHFRDEGWKHPERALTTWVPVVRMLGKRELEPRAEGSSKQLVHDRYKVIKSLGSGGFGSVVEAHDTLTGQRVALKELVRTSPSALARFKQEFRALQEVYHPNLVRLEALFEHQGTWFIAMELVEGVNFIQWVRPQHACDEQRLRMACAGLVRGLMALHEAGFLHRDLTPSNVRVTSEGRVVLMDFGLVTSFDEQESEAIMLGTVAYSAPEQIAGREVDSGADAYALGVCLFEALTGRLPFEGVSPMHVARAKRAGLDASDPRHARQLNTPIGSLCVSLLAVEPASRPSLGRVLELVDRGQLPALRPVSHIPPAEPGFAGRASQLNVLHEVFERVRAGSAKVVLIEGKSGVGKTALVNEHLQRLRSEAPTTLVLRGRCYENEQVPYKAFDGAIDVLAKTLRALSLSACEEILPAKAALLAQMFPVLASVQGIAHAKKRGLPAEPTARRLAALVALRELVSNLRKQRPVVIVVDDLQWADAESFRLLTALLNDENAPALLFLFTLRPESELQAEVAAQLEPIRTARQTTTVSLGCLTPAESAELASKLSATLPPAQLESIVRESQGHPLFIAELAQFAGRSFSATERDAVTLDSALGQRIKQLPADARRLLELVALAGRPYGRHVFARALERADGLAEITPTLLTRRLLRAGKDQQLECFHDRIRHVTLSLMSEATILPQRASLARSLEADAGTDPAEVARLWDAVGNVTSASAAYERAADAALESLAFARAEGLYARALELCGDANSDRTERLLIHRGHALARGGRSAEAACLYQQAAASSHGEPAIRLRIAAAQQLLQSAQIEEGLESSRAVLAELGESLPLTTSGALTQLLWARGWVALRGLAVKSSAHTSIEPHAKLTLDALLQLSMPVGWIHLLAGASLNARHLSLALSVGEPGHVARALAQEAAFRAVQDPQAGSHTPLLVRSRALVTGRGDAALEAFQTFMEGTSAFFCFELITARQLLESAQEQLQTRCPGEPWLLTSTRITLGGARAALGEHAQIATEVQAWLDEARERKDRFGIVMLFGLARGYVGHLMRHAPEEALAEIERAVAPWPKNPFSWAHVGELWTVAESLLYRGGDQCLEWFAEHEKRLRGAPMIRTAAVGEFVSFYRAQAALAALGDCADAQRGQLMRDLTDAARTIRKRALPLSASFALLIEAQRDALAGDADASLRAVRIARTGFAQRHSVYQHAALCLEGILEGGDAGREKRATALGFYRNQGWQKPDRALATYGLGALDALTARYGNL